MERELLFELAYSNNAKALEQYFTILDPELLQITVNDLRDQVHSFSHR